MPQICAVLSCKCRRGREKVSFFNLPAVIQHQGKQTEDASRQRRHAWLASIKRTKEDFSEYQLTTPGQICVCSRHFKSGKPSPLFDHLSQDWVPTIHLGHERTAKKRSATQIPAKKRRCVEQPTSAAGDHTYSALESDAVDHSVEPTTDDSPPPLPSSCSQASQGIATPRYERARARSVKKRIQVQEGEQKAERERLCCLHPSLDVNDNTKSSQTDLSGYDIMNMQTEIQEMKEHVDKLNKRILETEFNETSFEGNDEKTKFYTGLLNFSLLVNLFCLVRSYIPAHGNCKLSQFQMLLLTLIKLRLNIPFKDLAYRFSLSASRCSIVFDTVIDILHNRLSFLVKWPTRPQLRKTMPLSFKRNFGKKVTVIIDCFEVFIDRPGNLLARSLTWSHYKHHNTIKFLIGIAPQGVIIFLSNAWGGRTSDVHLTEHCGLFNHLLPGDFILADRGFDMSDSFQAIHTDIVVPAFMKKRNQLSPVDVEMTRKVANVRIHVERVIGTVRQKYQILGGPVPLSLLEKRASDSLSPIDKIARICCSLTNLCESVVTE